MAEGRAAALTSAMRISTGARNVAANWRPITGATDALVGKVLLDVGIDAGV